MASTATTQYQNISNKYYSIFGGKILETVEKLAIEKAGVTIVPVSVEEKAENTVLEDTDADDRLIKKAGQTVTSPSGVTLNQFSQPQFSQILSILDIIRNESNYPVGKPLTDINVAGITIVEEDSLTQQSDCLKTALDAMSLDDKMSIAQGLMDKIKKNASALSVLNVQNNKLKNSSKFTLSSIMGGVQSAISPAVDQTIKFKDENVAKLTGRIDSTIKQTGNLPSTVNNILTSNMNDLGQIPEELFDELKIIKSNLKPISKVSIDKVMKVFEEKKISCPSFNDLIKTTNRAASKSTINESQSIAQKTTQQLNDIQSQIDSITEDNKKMEELLSQIQL